MKCYLDSSVILRKILHQPQPLRTWSHITNAIASRLVRLECLRVLERRRLTGDLSDEQLAEANARLAQTLDGCGILPLSASVWKRAEQSFATPVGTLDSLHLATALLWRDSRNADLVFATHDQQLATAAKAHGLRVIGI